MFNNFFSPAIIGNLSISYTGLGVTVANLILSKWLCVTKRIESNWFEQKDKEFAEC